MIIISQNSFSLHNYFTIQIRLFNSDILITLYLNTESITIFINKTLINSYSYLYNIQKVHYITIYKLTNKQILNYFIYLFITLSVINSDSIFITI